jgi:dTDP-4-amino-4,6-dideoxygalactose transaminase
MDPILTLARQYGLRVVEDAAHALPTRYKRRLVGTLDSHVTVFSFYANKTMTTGEGGMVVTRHAELASRMKTMRLHGINRDAFDRFVATSPSWFYEVVAPGFKYNLTDIASALGIQQLRRVDRFLITRQKLAKNYMNGLNDLPLLLPSDALDGDTHAWHLFVVRLTAGSKIGRDEFIQRLSEKGIGTSVHYVPLHRHPYWRDTYHLQPKQFPIADHAYQAMVSLPLYTRLSAQDQQYVISSIREILC